MAEIQNSGAMPTDSIWSVREFRANSATSKMLALMLGHQHPVDLLTGQLIDVSKSLSWSNDKEFHHFFPKAYLTANGFTPRRANAIANVVLLTSISNIRTRDTAPSTYLEALRSEVGEEELRRRLALSLIDDSAYLAALDDDYEMFLDLRSKHLQQTALALVEIQGATGIEPAIETTAAPTADDTDSDTTE